MHPHLGETMPQNGTKPSLAARSKKLQRMINFYPPYLGSAVRVTTISEDFRNVEVEMPLRFYNRNYFRTHLADRSMPCAIPFMRSCW